MTEQVKRFVLFAGSDYYPSGGWDDFRSSHDTIEEAIAAAALPHRWGTDWWQVVDIQNGYKAADSWYNPTGDQAVAAARARYDAI